MSIRPLKDICEMFTGLAISNKAFGEDGGEYHVVQIRDVTNSGLKSNLKKADIAGVNFEKELRKGDVLLKSRGYDIHAYALDKIPNQTIATNGFIILRPYSDIKSPVVSSYLAWVLNNFSTQLNRHAQGTIIRMININMIQNVLLPFPDLKKQKAVMDIQEQIEIGKITANEYFKAISRMLRQHVQTNQGKKIL